jgi:hypothetical protein
VPPRNSSWRPGSTPGSGSSPAELQRRSGVVCDRAASRPLAYRSCLSVSTRQRPRQKPGGCRAPPAARRPPSQRPVRLSITAHGPKPGSRHWRRKCSNTPTVRSRGQGDHRRSGTATRAGRHAGRPAAQGRRCASVAAAGGRSRPHPSQDRSRWGARRRPALTPGYCGWDARPRSCWVLHVRCWATAAPAVAAGGCGRSHSHTWVGCIVSSTTATSSAESVSRSTSSRSRALNAWIVRAAS